MARLRATEHHIEGPGDAPRRRKGRKSKPVEDIGGSSPMKRTASPSVQVSAKRVKRVHIEEHIEEHVDDHVQDLVQDQAGENVEQAVRQQTDHAHVSHSQPADTITLATPAEQVRRARRRFSEPLGANDGGLATPTNSIRQIKHAQSRRARMSMPAQMHHSQPVDVDGVREIQYVPLKQTLDVHLKRRLRRNHLSEEMNDIEDQKKREGRLKKAMAELSEELQRKKKIIQDLEFQLEARRLGDIEMSDDQTAELRHQLDTAHQEIEELKNSSVYAPETGDFSALAHSDGFDDDDDELMLVDPEDLDISQDDLRTTPLPNGYYATRSLEASQITVESLSGFEETTQDRVAEAGSSDFSTSTTDKPVDKISERTKQRYEAEIEALMHRVADAQGALRCVTIELQNLDIVDPGASAADILTALRRVLESSREKYEAMFAHSTAELSNSAFIRKLVQDLEGMSAELLAKVEVSDTLKERVKLVEAQYEGTMALLATEMKQNEALGKANEELGTVNTEQKLKLEQLSNSLDRESERVKQQDEKIDEQNTLIHGLEEKLEDNNNHLTRVTTALDQYRQEVQTLTDTINRLEQEHADHISSLQQDHTMVVQGLEGHLKAEEEARAQAEDEATQKTEYIEELQGRMVELDSQIDEVSNKVSELRARLSEEMEGRSAAETECNEQAVLLNKRAQQIETLDDTVSDLRSEIEQTKMNLVAERTQRQQTEADLSDANDKIDQLNDQLHQQGLQANELRSKLFQVQQERERVVAELKEAADARNNAYEQLLDDKEKLREEAEQRISRLESRVEELEEELATAQSTLDATKSARDALEVERDEQLQTLNRQLEELRNKYTALQASSKMQIDTLQTTITDVSNENNDLRITRPSSSRLSKLQPSMPRRYPKRMMSSPI
jgi:myosin protein heavy chain